VVNDFIESHKSGGTPNPCVVCNRKVRWDILMGVADDLNADFIATGHYARISTDKTGKKQLLRGIDQMKDQSYVLHGLTQEKLSWTKFPLGRFKKSEIRNLARRFNLPVAERPDSQDLCFVGNQGYQDFLRRLAPDVLKPGPIINKDGVIIGHHKGLALYTIGQRKGLRIASTEPYYVMQKNISKNQLIIGFLNELGSDELIAKDVNWIAGEPLQNPIQANIKIRYKARNVGGTITPLDHNRVQVKFNKPLRDITPDQDAVFYNGDICLGGGTIQIE
jgi:tRNA-specific 2-thiouridylase